MITYLNDRGRRKFEFRAISSYATSYKLLSSSDLVTMKSKIVVPPTEIFQKENLTPEDIGEELNI